MAGGWEVESALTSGAGVVVTPCCGGFDKLAAGVGCVCVTVGVCAGTACVCWRLLALVADRLAVLLVWKLLAATAMSATKITNIEPLIRPILSSDGGLRAGGPVGGCCGCIIFTSDYGLIVAWRTRLMRLSRSRASAKLAA